MSRNEIEILERTTFEMVVQALIDYRDTAVSVFKEEEDQVQDIAEDMMREAVESMGISGFQERLYGKVDYKKAIYAFIPDPRPVALMLDAKAEKEDKRTTTIQMSQTSMKVRYVNRRTGKNVVERGRLSHEIERDGRKLHVVSIIAKYFYAESDNTKGFELKQIIVACIPNGALQRLYNPTPQDTIWQVGRQSEKHGEDFRVRLNYGKLKDKAEWRVRYIDCS